VPTLEVQTLPQPPQFETLTVVSVSQPSAMPLTQSAWPVLHWMAHVPFVGSVQLALPPLSEHLLSQLPQVSGALRSASQPLAELPSQSAKPTSHFTLQTPSVQVPVPLSGLQACPQPPQWPSAVLVFVSQPFDGSPSQSV
jgi:hypothetical protein